MIWYLMIKSEDMRWQSNGYLPKGLTYFEFFTLQLYVCFKHLHKQHSLIYLFQLLRFHFFFHNQQKHMYLKFYKNHKMLIKALLQDRWFTCSMKIPLTEYIGLIKSSTTVASASWSTCKGTLRVLCTREGGGHSNYGVVHMRDQRNAKKGLFF